MRKPGNEMHTHEHELQGRELETCVIAVCVIFAGAALLAVAWTLGIL